MLKLILLAASIAPSVLADAFRESLTLQPLPDGKLSVLFEFTTDFTSTGSASVSHHSLTPPALLLPLAQNNVSELTVSFVSGQWDQVRSGRSGPAHVGGGGGGGEVRGWLRSDQDLENDVVDDKRRRGGRGIPSTNTNTGTDTSAGTDHAWEAVTHALGGLFCATLGPGHVGESVRTFGGVYPPVSGRREGLKHYYLPQPNQQLCTENLTPFLSLLPSKGLSGLSHLLAQPGVVLSWGFQAEGIQIAMPDPYSSSVMGKDQGSWNGWWEGVVDLVPVRGRGQSGLHPAPREFSLESLFGRRVPRAFPEAESSVLRVISGEEEGSNAQEDKMAMMVEPQESRKSVQWIDGKAREVREWDLKEMAGADVRVWWDGEETYRYPATFDPPPITTSRRVVDAQAGDGTFLVRLTNSSPLNRTAIYSEVWPWWVKGWMSEMTVRAVGHRDSLLSEMLYRPSHPPKPSTTSLHLSITLPAHTTVEVRIPFTKLTLKYTEHRPDAERGVEIPSGVLTLLDVEGDALDQVEAGGGQATIGELNPLKTSRRHIYTQRLLLDVPTPDFSMPYNVIIMSSTVMAIFFGLMQGALTRRWGFVDVGPSTSKEGQEGEKLKSI